MRQKGMNEWIMKCHNGEEPKGHSGQIQMMWIFKNWMIILLRIEKQMHKEEITNTVKNEIRRPQQTWMWQLKVFK